MANSELAKKAGDYVYELLKKELPHNFVYHNYNHTLDVVRACKEIGKKTDLSDDEMETVLLAAWFHDTGYIKTYDGHEERSAEIAEKFLRENNVSDGKLEEVKSCILATKYPPSPKNRLEEVVCDADLEHIATDDYTDKSDLLRVEWERQGKSYSDLDWMKQEIEFLSQHRFFTKYARKQFEEAKIAHLLKLRRKYKKRLELQREEEKQKAKLEIAKEKLETKKEAESKAGRGIETMFRNAVRTHVEFSAMADSKANIMISINTLLIGIIVTVMIRKLDSNPHLTFPTFLLLAVCLFCIVFAILVTRPKYTTGRFTKDDIYQKKTNLLFFGNFYNMDLADFQWGMNEMIYDKEYLYGSMIKDFYFLGQVLGKKYKYLRWCYTIFMFGLIAAVVAYAVAFVIYPGTNLNFLEDLSHELTRIVTNCTKAS
jgi:predicted metal-dependent HD superfamily phosphohydrolase